mmetsp:Transcript_24184/g.52140  ORF Transcript_24184/g.52140 Transcript_24184/m.52140 type:complete len:236 (-) Transcript_24184:94-801(-)|eukprot:CAMPEP_0183349808 /NCGR_PEP_ID=MMETSP0164_2-20130417/13878_1 /TAXON_ID=221442 /ORGANISM="Coccolithus pelagicus ssp braarudi, Strain PLY182g" /LENGTH=235 /DNA_ID=CAMNT_0025521597 /DNA_START=17 /DNA_END=724 /DNA_ORIENTATION=-
MRILVLVLAWPCACTCARVQPLVHAAASVTCFTTASELCIDTFEKVPFPRALTRPRLVRELTKTLQARCADGLQHELLIAYNVANSVPIFSLGEAGGTGVASEVVIPENGMNKDWASYDFLGCVEVGMLPPPPTRPGSDVPYIANLVVDPTARRQGIALHLVDASEQLCREWGHAELYCKVARDNLPARRLYDQCGFRPIFLQTLRADWRNKQQANIFMIKNVEDVGGDNGETAG